MPEFSSIRFCCYNIYKAILLSVLPYDVMGCKQLGGIDINEF